MIIFEKLNFVIAFQWIRLEKIGIQIIDLILRTTSITLFSQFLPFSFHLLLVFKPGQIYQEISRYAQL
jgi:hypothetical protein